MFKILLFHGIIKKNEFKIRNYNSKHILEKKFFKILKALKKKHSFLSMEEIYFFVQNKQKLPKNSSPVRAHNRCKLTGRPKGYMRQFGISRVLFREMANKGLIPGVRKASW